MKIDSPRKTSSGCNHQMSARIVWPNERRGIVVVVDPFIASQLALVTVRSDGLGSRRNMTAGKPSLLELLRLLHSFAVRSFHGQLCLFPGFPTAGDVPKLTKSFRFQDARGDARTITAAAVNRRGFAAIKLIDSLAQFRQENVVRARNTSLFPFPGRTHIENLQ